MPQIVIGLTGSFGSGCSFIAEHYFVPEGFKYISLSKLLKKLYIEKTEIKEEDFKRSDLQAFGNEMRQENGGGFFAEQAIEMIEAEKDYDCWVIDSIKNPDEIKAFESQFTNFFMIGIYADFDIRWERVGTTKYSSNQGDFRIDDEKDSGEDIAYGQRVSDCFVKSDIVVINNKTIHTGSRDDLEMKLKIQGHLNLINKKGSRQPSEEEALMAIAYGNSLRSSCLKRKVGAVIVDGHGFIISSGFNEVPMGEYSCLSEYGQCYRKEMKNDIERKIDAVDIDMPFKLQIKNGVLKNYKMLEHCRSLHAEENAILKVPKSNDLSKSVLYTTTYPCNMCANKIAQIGLGKVIYLEPYPQKAAKKLLDSQDVRQKPFEGVSYKGYFKLFGGDNSD